MSYVSSRTFCCCLPVRLGVVIIAVLGLGLGGLVGIAGAVQVSKYGSTLSTTSKAAYCIQIVVYGSYALMSLLGLIGAIGRKRGMITAFYSILIVHLLFSIASGSFSLYTFFHDAPQIIDNCINGSDDDAIIQSCNKGTSIMKGVLVGACIFLWLMEIWGCVIVNDYRKQLEEEEVVEAKDAMFLRA